LVRDLARLGGRRRAIADAGPIQADVIAAEERAAAALIWEHFPGLQRPIVVRLWAAIHAFRDAAREDSELREAAKAALRAVNGGAPSNGNFPWLQPPGAAALLEDQALKSGARELRMRWVERRRPWRPSEGLGASPDPVPARHLWSRVPRACRCLSRMARASIRPRGGRCRY
jgi:hypothetical protein